MKKSVISREKRKNATDYARKCLTADEIKGKIKEYKKRYMENENDER